MKAHAVQRVAEHEVARRLRIVEGLDAEVVSGTEETIRPSIPDGIGKVAKQMLDAILAPGVIRVKDELRIRTRLQHRAALGLQLPIRSALPSTRTSPVIHTEPSRLRG